MKKFSLIYGIPVHESDLFNVKKNRDCECVENDLINQAYSFCPYCGNNYFRERTFKEHILSCPGDDINVNIYEDAKHGQVYIGFQFTYSVRYSDIQRFYKIIKEFAERVGLWNETKLGVYYIMEFE